MTSSSSMTSALRALQVIGLIDEGNGYATAAAEVVARGMTDDAERLTR
jgi:hypothetical protein